MGLFMFILGTAGNVLPWTNPFILLASVLFPCAVYLLALTELHAMRPILPLMLTKFPFRNIMINGFLLSMINYTVRFTY